MTIVLTSQVKGQERRRINVFLIPGERKRSSEASEQASARAKQKPNTLYSNISFDLSLARDFGPKRASARSQGYTAGFAALEIGYKKCNPSKSETVSPRRARLLAPDIPHSFLLLGLRIHQPLPSGLFLASYRVVPPCFFSQPHVPSTNECR